MKSFFFFFSNDLQCELIGSRFFFFFNASQNVNLVILFFYGFIFNYVCMCVETVYADSMQVFSEPEEAFRFLELCYLQQ